MTSEQLKAFSEGLDHVTDTTLPAWLVEGAKACAKALAGRDASFELRWKADIRAIERWQSGNLERALVMPDHADLCMWLLEQLTSTERKLEQALRSDAEDNRARWIAQAFVLLKVLRTQKTTVGNEQLLNDLIERGGELV